MIQDRINATMEVLGIIFALYNCHILIGDGGKVMGISIASTAFFTLWGAWNLYYYRFLDQGASSIAAGGLVVANGAWIVLYIIYNTVPTA